MIDSVLALQLPSGRWYRTSSAIATSYLDLDALYALRLLCQSAPDHRKEDVAAAVVRYAGLLCAFWPETFRLLETAHPHQMLAAAGTLGLLQHFLPDRFPDSVAWTDIFSDRRFYRTDAVETPLAAPDGR